MVAEPSIFQSLQESLPEVAASALNKLGLEVARLMKKELRSAQPHPSIYSGNLVDSITYAVYPAKTSKYFPYSETRPGNPVMSLVGSRANRTHVISSVDKPHTCVVGTGDPKAKYVNYGTRAHKKWTDHAEFVVRIEEWCLDHGFDRDFAEYLMQKIRYMGTAAVDFLTPAENFAKEFAKMYADFAVKKLLKSLPVVLRTITEKGTTIKIKRKR